MDLMRTTTLCLLSTFFMFACAAEPAGTDTETESGTETETGETETETGADPDADWTYSSPMQPSALAATADSVVVGGSTFAEDPDDPSATIRIPGVIALDSLGEPIWSATWMSEDDLPSSISALAWEPNGTWVGFGAQSCGDGCLESRVAYLDPQGVEQWRLDPPFSAGIRNMLAAYGDLIVVGYNSNPATSHMIRLGADGSELWRWDSPGMTAPPLVNDVEVGDDGVLWAVGSRLDEGFDAPWLAQFDFDTGEIIDVLGANFNGPGQSVEFLGDGLVVGTDGKLAALEIDGVQTWQVTIPDGLCPTDSGGGYVLIGCEAQIQLRDEQSMLAAQWAELEQVTAGYYWRDVAMGARAYAAIGSPQIDGSTPGKVYGLTFEE